MKTDLRAGPLLRRVIGLSRHRAHRPVDSPSLAPYVEGRHRRGLAEVFRRSFNAAIAERAERLNQQEGSGAGFQSEAPHSEM